MNEAARFSEEVGRVRQDVSFNRQDPASVRAAIQEIEAAVDRIAAGYPGNQMVRQMAAEFKASQRKGLQDQAERAMRGEGRRQ